MADQKVGDCVVSKREDGTYDIQQFGDQRDIVRNAIETLDEARTIARNRLSSGGKVWYRDHRDPPDHLEPL